MGLHVEPAYIGQTGYEHPVELDRNVIEAIWGRTGAVQYTEFQISPGVGTRAVAVSVGRAVLVGVENAQQGAYFVWSDAIETYLLAAAVGNPRIDTLILRVLDDQYGTISGLPRAEIEVVQGVAAGSPTARPDSDFNVGGSFYEPGAWWRLGDVRVNVADTGSIPGGQFTSNNRYVRNAGGLYVVENSADMQAISGQRLGDIAYRVNKGWYYRWDGTRWSWPGARGVVGGVRYNAGTGSFLTTNGGPAEFLPGITTPSIVMEADRRFRFIVKQRVLTASGAGTVYHSRLRETNISGQIRAQFRSDFGINSAETMIEYHGTYVTGSTDETKTFVVSLTTSAGVVNSYAGDATEWVGVEVEDVGPALPNVVTVV